jgi:hypothetical protein
MITKEQAIKLAETQANEEDLDFPTKQKQQVYDEFTAEEPWGWVFYYAACEDRWVRGRDPAAQDNPPILVSRSSAQILPAAPGDDLTELIRTFDAA